MRWVVKRTTQERFLQIVNRCKSSSGVGALLRNSDFSGRGAGGKAAVPERDDGVCLTTDTGTVQPGP